MTETNTKPLTLEECIALARQVPLIKWGNNPDVREAFECIYSNFKIEVYRHTFTVSNIIYGVRVTSTHKSQTIIGEYAKDFIDDKGKDYEKIKLLYGKINTAVKSLRGITDSDTLVPELARARALLRTRK
jgi:hypothetical protein